MNHYIQWYLLFGIGLFASILLMLEIGRRVGIRVRKRDPEGATAGVSVVDGAIFGLMGLLIGFTFSGANSRFDAQRELIIHESEIIGTAYLRVNLLPERAQPRIRQNFRKYLDTRLAISRKLPDVAAAKPELEQLEEIEQDIWSEAITGTTEKGDSSAKMLVLNSLNEMFDMANTRTERSRIHPPMVIHTMLVILVLLCSTLAGSLMAGSETRNWAHILGFAIMMSVTVLVILDLEYPRLGTIRIDSWDRVLTDLRAQMK
jgi:hypothetical protein